MDASLQSAIFTAAAALFGAGVGGLSTFMTTMLTQRYASRRELITKDLANREILYASFIKEAAILFADSLDKILDKPTALIDLFALMGRMRLISTASVLGAAEKVGRDIIESYRRPAVKIQQLLEREDLADPLREFTQACRDEREIMLGHIASTG